ncbi:MarR family winged helix-turn-helix transcriptional regulator [Pseudoramibacter alactolyticus]|jgi:DNA-binding MarR family transcriptional regulator|nr:MarR family transcriptional regulator [Pseudoramibacter alactolyticus]
MTCNRQRLIEATVQIAELGDACSEHVKARCCEDALTARQMACLRVLDTNKNVTFSDLAVRFGLSKPTVTELIGKLMDSGCVVKEKSREDRRVYYIRLTDKGKTIARMKLRAQMQLVEQIESQLNEIEIETLITLIHKIVSDDRRQ